MPNIKTVNPNLGAGKFLFGQFDPNRSSEQETLIANAGALPDGTPIAKFTAGGNNGKVAKWDPAGTNGQNVAIGFLFGDKVNKASTQRVVVVERHQVVNGNLLDYTAITATGPEKTAMEASLKAAGIIVRR